MANKIIVSQIGGRHNYLIPKVLEDNNLLYRFYTDSTCYSLLGRMASMLSKIGIKFAQIQRLLNRRPSISKRKLYNSDSLYFKQLIAHFCSLRSYKELIYTGLNSICKHWGVGDADCVYTMYFENLEFCRYAKSKGLKIVTDIYEPPMEYKYLIEEVENNPEYALFADQLDNYKTSHAVRLKYVDELLSLADYYTVPSKFVITSMQEFKNFDPQKVLFQPYGSSVVVKDYCYKPVRHRIIWVGSDPIRKGILYCAKAAAILKQRYPDLDFRMIGANQEDFVNMPICKNLHFIGQLNKQQLTEEYCSAEAYVFPTLFEGFAGTVIEAGSCGCPIITTASAGTDVDEFPAIYIPIKDTEAIVKSVIDIFENSDKRDNLSKKVFDYCQRMKPENYQKSLVNYLKQI